MIWHATEHSKMKPIKDPRVDRDGGQMDTADMKQSDLAFEEPNPTPDNGHA
jgi:hypothetical protein